MGEWVERQWGSEILRWRDSEVVDQLDRGIVGQWGSGTVGRWSAEIVGKLGQSDREEVRHWHWSNRVGHWSGVVRRVRP